MGTTKDTRPVFIHDAVKTPLPKGKKFLRVRASVDGSDEKFTMSVTYDAAQKFKDQELIVVGQADGVTREYDVVFPEIEALDIASMRMAFPGISAESTVSIEYMQLIGETIAGLGE